MLHIRLRRIGKKKQPSYRLIVCEKTKDPWGDYLENLGTYNPRKQPSVAELKADRIKEWISKGAQCSDTVWNLLVDKGVVIGDKRKTIEISTKRKAKVADKNAAKKAEEEEKKQKAEEAKKAEEEAAKAEEAKKAEEATATEDVAQEPSSADDTTPSAEESAPAESAETEKSE